MKEIELSQLATGVPYMDFKTGIKEALKTFEEHSLYDFMVVLKEGKPVGIVSRLELIKAQHRDYLTVGDLAKPLMKLRNSSLKPEQIPSLLDFFNSQKNPIFLVDKGGHYMGVLFYHVVMHYASLYKETAIPVFQKLSSLFAQDYYFYCFYIRGIKEFRDTYGAEKTEGIYKILIEDIKDHIEGDVSFSKGEGEVYALSKTKLSERDVRNIYEEFHKEFSLLYAEAKLLHVHGYCIPLKEVKTFEEFFRISSELKNRLKGMQELSFFIFYQEVPVIVACEYKAKELIPKIKEKIKGDFEKVVEHLKRTEKDLWEFVLYDFFKEYPYFELFYIMNEKGVQISNNVINPKISYRIKAGKKGADRSEKSYFKQAMKDGTYISDIYISQATDDFCITLSARFQHKDKTYVLAGDINYREIHQLVKSYTKASL
jgi:hypothetical protein